MSFSEQDKDAHQVSSVFPPLPPISISPVLSPPPPRVLRSLTSSSALTLPRSQALYEDGHSVDAEKHKGHLSHDAIGGAAAYE